MSRQRKTKSFDMSMLNTHLPPRAVTVAIDGLPVVSYLNDGQDIPSRIAMIRARCRDKLVTFDYVW